MIVGLSFRFGTREYGVSLDGPRHIVVTPPELPLRSLRDALCATLYGAEMFPGGPRGGLKAASLTFDVNGLRYRASIDLTTGHRTLAHEQGARIEKLADSAGAVDQMLTALLHLPSPLVFRSLTLSSVDFPERDAPRISDGLHRSLQAHAADPSQQAAAYESTRRRLESAKAALNRAPAVEWPGRDALALGGFAAGAVALFVGWASVGAGRYLGLLGPAFFGLAAWRALRWIDGTQRRRECQAAVDEADAAVRARRRHLEELEAALCEVERLTGSRSPTSVAALFADGSDVVPDPGIADHVDVYAGGPPPAARVLELEAAFGVRCAATASAGLVLAAVESRGTRPAPLIWMADGAGETGLQWSRVFERVARTVPLIVFCRAAGAGDLGVRLEPTSDEGSP